MLLEFLFLRSKVSDANIAIIVKLLCLCISRVGFFWVRGTSLRRQCSQIVRN